MRAGRARAGWALASLFALALLLMPVLLLAAEGDTLSRAGRSLAEYRPHALERCALGSC